MSGKIFVGNTGNIATLPKNILVGNANNIAKKVKTVYVGNSQNQAVKVWPNIILPEPYQQVEYIRNLYTVSSAGSDNRSPSFIIENVVVSSFSRIIVDFAITNHGRTVGWGNDTTDLIFACYRKGMYFTVGLESNDYPKLWVRGKYFDNYSDRQITTPIESDERYIIDLNRSNGECYINNEFFFTGSGSLPDTNAMVALFCYNNRNSYPESISPLGTYAISYKLYKCEIYNDDLVMNVVPCYRKSDHFVGLYETVSETFLYQPKYTAGPNV